MKNLYWSAANTQHKFCYFAGAEALTEPLKAPIVADVENAMKTTIKPGEKSREAYVLLKVLDELYPNNGILNNKEKEGKIATVGPKGTKYLKQFQREHVAYFANNEPDGIAEGGKSTWKAILEKAKLQSDKAVVQEKTKVETKALTSDIEKNYDYQITLPKWFVNAENDAVRVATINRLSKGFEQFGRRSNGGGNEAKIIRALKAVHSEAFADTIVGNATKDEKLIVTTDQLKAQLPGLDAEDYKRVLVLLEQVSANVNDSVDKAYIEDFNKSGKANAQEPENAGLLNKTLLVDTTWGDLPLEVKVVDGEKPYQIVIAGDNGYETTQLTRGEIDELVEGKTIAVEDQVIVQAQGVVFKTKKTNAEVKRFYGEDGRDINLDKGIISKLTIPKKLQRASISPTGGEATYSGTSDEADRILSGAIHYLTNMMNVDERSKYIAVNEKGEVYMTGDKIKNVLQSVLDQAVNEEKDGNGLRKGLTPTTNSQMGGADIETYYVDIPKVNAMTHRAAEGLLEGIEWDIKRITNSDLDRLIEGATIKEKTKIFGITLSEMERELSRDEFVAAGAQTDYFEVFERKMNTDLEKLLLDKVINDPAQYKIFEDAVVKMGETRWDMLQENRSFFDKIFSNSLSADQIRNIKFRIGSYHLLQKSRREGTDLATEFKRLYEGTDSQIKGIAEALGNPEEAKVLKSLGLVKGEIGVALQRGIDQGVFANLKESELLLGIAVTDVNDGSDPHVPAGTREHIDHSSSHSSSTDSERTTERTDWEEFKNETWQEERDGYIYTYTRTRYRRTRTDTEKTTTTEKNATTDVYKITKYKKENPEAKLEISIDARQNVVTVKPVNGIDLGLDAGVGAIINRLSDTGYLSLKLGAEGRLTTKTTLNAAVGEKWRADGELINLASFDVSHQINDNLNIFAGASNNSVESFYELLDLDQATTKVGGTYSFDEWDLTAEASVGNDLTRLAVIFKKNENYFIEHFKDVVRNIPRGDADAHTKAIYGDNIDVEQYRSESKLFLGGLVYSKEVRGTITKFGISATSVDVDKILSIVLGIATSADVIKQVMPHENKGNEKLRAYLQKSGDFISKIRHAQKINMEELSLGDDKYRLLPEGYAENYLPKNEANANKYVEVNTYVDPSIKDQVEVNGDGTFTLKNGLMIKPFILNKTLADGHTEINVYIGDYKAGAFDSAKLMSSGRIKAGGSFELSETLNTGTEKVSVHERVAKRMGAFTALENAVFEKMNDAEEGEAFYKAMSIMEKELRVDTQNPNFEKRIEELLDPKHDNNVVKFAMILEEFAEKNNLTSHEIVNSIVKARMKYDAEKKHGENFEKVKDYTEFINKKRNYASNYKDTWPTAMEAMGADLSQLGDFADPKTALRSVDKREDNDMKSYSGGHGYIMAPNGQAVVLNKINATEVMHPNEKIITTPKGTFKIITGYLKECRNPMFIIQEIKPEGGSAVSDQEQTSHKTGLDIHSIDIALGIRLTPPKITSEIAYETAKSSDRSSSTTTETDSEYEYKEETTWEREPIKEEPPDTEDPVF